MPRLFDGTPTSPTGATGPSGRRPERRLRILVIDDDPLVLRTLRELVTADGHDVTVADGGQAGIDAFHAALAEGTRLDVVITDLGMPHIDGRRVAASIKSAAPSVPVVLLTGWGQDADILGDSSLSVDRVIGKPLRLALLRQVLAELTDGGR